MNRLRKCAPTAVCLLIFLFLVYIQLPFTVEHRENISNSTNCSTFANILTSSKTPSFVETIREYPWERLLLTYQNKKNNTDEFSFWCSKLLLQLTPALITPPKVRINTSCAVPPPPKFPSNVPTCKKLQVRRKVAVLLQFGFDADILEIHFQELDDLVDKFFIIESTTTYYLGVRKPLIWDALKGQPRFEKFLNKVVHFIVDDQDVLSTQLDMVKIETKKAQGNIYSIEGLQERMRWMKFVQWNSIANYFDGDDLLGFGDSDEIPYRNVIFYLKHCEMPSDPVDIGIWFPYGKIDQVFQTDWPVRGHPYTYGDPTYWTLKAAMAYGESFHGKPPPTRLRGRGPGFLIGGIHMTHYGYFPFQLAKILSKIEAVEVHVQIEISVQIQFVMNELKVQMRNESMSKYEQLLALRNMEAELAQTTKSYAHRLMKLELFRSTYPEEYVHLIKLPWFYDCNRERYPLWEGKHDTRLDD